MTNTCKTHRMVADFIAQFARRSHSRMFRNTLRRAQWSWPLLLLLNGCATAQLSGTSNLVALVGGTVIDVRDGGSRADDLHDSIVIIAGDKIAAVGSRDTILIPTGATIIDVTGDFIVPGLIDGFAGLNSQAQANATLYMGVTTIVGSGDDRRGVLKLDAVPTPHVYPIDSAGSQDDYSLLIGLPGWAGILKEGAHPAELSIDDTERQLVETARRGTRAIWLGHNLTAPNVRRIVERSHALGLVTYGEFISTSYTDGLASGVDVLLHMSRYELGLVPDALQRPLVASPEGAAQKAPYDYISRLDSSDPSVAAYAARIKASDAVLMPTFSLAYLELPNHRNLWNEPAASILDAKDLHLPPDRITGEADFPNEALRARVVNSDLHFWAINQAMFSVRPPYLAASGASAVGTMPGISMHTELELLVRLGLTPRQALAAATSNYAAHFRWNELGLVEKGRRADLLILSADPTVDIANSRKISSVILDGRVLDRASLLNAAR